MPFSTLLLPALQFSFIGVIFIFLVNWCVRKLKSVTKVWGKSSESNGRDDERQREEVHNSKHNVWKQNLQKCYVKEAERYKEEVLIPRDKRRQEQREKEFRKHFGPLWSGVGQQLGGEEIPSGEDEHEFTESVKAARRRKIPEPEYSLTQTKVKEQKLKQPKKVIDLPSEPAESDPEALEVILRTPISTIVKRRFLPHHSIQNVQDFMTTKGFSQSHYQLCTSFPRLLLSDSQVALCELGFGKRITMNIEEKE